MIKIGITGGIGCGKSVVADLFQLLGIPVYIADTESKQLTETSLPIREKLTLLLGKRLYKDGQLDKPYFASRIFGNEPLLQQVNGIIHPIVKDHFLSWVEQQQTAICAIESAILFESGFYQQTDKILMVYAPESLRIQRALKRDATSKEAIIRRIKNQMSDEIKKEKSDYIIYNNDELALIPQIIAFLKMIKSE